MILNVLNKTATIIVTVFDVVITCAINIVVVPITLLYTAVTSQLSDRWKLSDISGIYYFWWSHKEKIIKCANSTGLSSHLNVLTKCPRLLLVLFVAVAVPVTIAAIIRLAIRAFSKRDTKKQDDIVIVETDKQRKQRRKTRRKNEAEN